MPQTPDRRYSEIELKLRAELKLCAECERGFTVGEPTANYLSVTAEPYVQICGKVSNETDEIQFFPTIEAAYGAQIEAFRQYVAGKSGSLYWRAYPELGQNRARDGWAFYMRVLISDMPVIKKPAEG